MHLGQGSGKEHAIKEEYILHAVLQAQKFVCIWQKVEAISLKDNYFIYNSYMAIVYKSYRMRFFLFFFSFFFFSFSCFAGYICFPKLGLTKNN